MIIQNGFIEPKLKKGGGIDSETGYAIEPESIWGKPIPCQYIHNTHNNLGSVNGEHYKIATYTVLIEEQPFCAEQVKLTTLRGREVGEYSIISIEPLVAVDEIRILI